MSAAKAVVAFFVAFLGALLVEWEGPHDPFQVRDAIVALSVSLSSGFFVYITPNRG